MKRELILPGHTGNGHCKRLDEVTFTSSIEILVLLKLCPAIFRIYCQSFFPVKVTWKVQELYRLFYQSKVDSMKILGGFCLE